MSGMSALGQKQHVQCDSNVRFVPIADTGSLIRSPRQSARVEKIEKVPKASGNPNLSRTRRSN
jgi:hypothetical protein